MPGDDKPLVLITGSTGLIGAHLTEALLEDHRVVGLDIKPPPEPHPAAPWLECDLTDGDALERTLQQVRSDYGTRVASVVHLAAYYDFSGEPSPLYDELTVKGTRRLLDGLKRFEEVEQLIFSSSTLVMRPAREWEWLTEESPTQAEWDYPQSKLAAEKVIREHHGRIPALILRIAGVYDENCNSIPIAQQIARIYEKRLESHLFPGHATKGQSFIHLQDLIDCFVQAIRRRNELAPLETLLVAEPDVMTYDELQDAIGEGLYGGEWTTLRVPKTVAKIGAWVQEKRGAEDETFIKPWMVDLADQHYPVDIQRARERLAWEPRHRLRDTLGEMLERLEEDPAAWYQANGLQLAE